MKPVRQESEILIYEIFFLITFNWLHQFTEKKKKTTNDRKIEEGGGWRMEVTFKQIYRITSIHWKHINMKYCKHEY